MPADEFTADPTELSLETLSRVGFGGYRITTGVSEHRAALVQALLLGCNLIDTAANYADGKSEEVIGEVLASDLHVSAFVVTKAGYISASTEKLLNLAGVSVSDNCQISAESKHSIAPEVLRTQMNISRRRLRRPRLDALLLHNPEHYFDYSGEEKSVDEYHAEIRRAFEFLEECVAAGELRYYGVSSNTLAANGKFVNTTKLDHLLKAARAVSSTNHFRFIEFPFNLLEREAAAPGFNGQSLIDEARLKGLISLANRPLNGLRENQMIRLATYEEAEPDAERANDAYSGSVELIRKRLAQLDLQHDVMDFTVMQFLRDNWRGVDSPDLVDQIFARQFYPFVNRLWNGSFPGDVLNTFHTLHEYARLFAKRRLSERARLVRSELAKEGLISFADKRSLAAIACDFCLASGCNHVLIGMRSVAYVNSLRELIQS